MSGTGGAEPVDVAAVGIADVVVAAGGGIEAD